MTTVKFMDGKGRCRQGCQKRRTHGRSLALAPLVLLLAVLPLPSARAAAADAGAPATRPVAATPDESAELRRHFADLDSADPAARDAARAALMAMPRRQLDAFRRLVEASRPLRPSQRVLLREIVTHVYLAGEPYEAREKLGFLGITMEPTAGSRVIVTSREPGFPAYPAFQNGDVIVRIAERPDVPCTDSQVFGAAVKELGAGRRVHFDVLRGGRIVRVAAILAPCPAQADGATNDFFKKLIADRRTLADDYWEQAFAPLFKERVG